MKIKLFSYNVVDTPIHRLSGVTKLGSFLFLSFAVMFSYDIRVVLAIMLFSLGVFKVSKIKFSQVKAMLIYVLIFLVTNALITFLFEPEYGVKIYGTRHEIIHLVGRYRLTWEQLFYQNTKIFKYVAVIPFGIVFLLTTNPSEFGASLNSIGVNYKVAYAVTLTLRYFPDVQRDYHNISQAQQARGLEMSKKSSLFKRFKNALIIIIPLIFSAIDRVESISNAMDLRGFGKGKKRSWYNKGKMTLQDYTALTISILILITTILISVFVNKSRFFNPFI
ncbi:energy-coupling factor transporter transmembrane component T family protein [Clostridium grantii]|uniref:Energy-coupling factor transport system permease protein n=1 Tax=Clostridium grantii DSM 8605 TaxID=1121316 RepID=A0A1M5VZE8_9CLOT|nr:energy-coupling factor transporter transmembrane component T [Clostridium grantii]SHH80699.1 energy-coupling factor transport system permease protein [Clostridium grantii DSM 8605]